MRLALLSDIHANLPALRAVLADAEGRGAERVACLGDIVGRNTEPAACIALLRACGAVCVAGNHDLAAAGLLGTEGFGLHAARAIAWTRARLSAADHGFLAGLPMEAVVAGQVLCVHGAPLAGGASATERLEDPAGFARGLAGLAAHRSGALLCAHGHTHRAGAVAERGGRAVAVGGARVALDAGTRWLLNPGSVGAPRDGETGAQWLLLDLDARMAEFRRVRFGSWLPRARSWCAGLTRRSAILPEPVGGWLRRAKAAGLAARDGSRSQIMIPAD